MTLATGGTVTDIDVFGVPYRVHTFTTSGDFDVIVGGEVEYLIVAGGGGGGYNGGGGGGGGECKEDVATVAVGTATVVVGAGGTGVNTNTAQAANGNSSALTGVLVDTALGGGGGGSLSTIGRSAATGGGGGSNGGATVATGSVGGDGGRGVGGGVNATMGGGGGGGMTGNGVAGSTTLGGGSGGTGFISSITGTAVSYGGGGGGGARSLPFGLGVDGGGDGGNDATNGSNGVDGRGGGGGGNRATASPRGGNGIVIIRYRLPSDFFVPDPTVTIGTTDFTADAIDTVTITRGRDTVYSEPQPGYATIRLIDKTGAGLPIEVGQTLTVDLEPSRTVFAGTITDWNAQLYDPGLRGNAAAVYTLTAVGPLATLNRRTIFISGRAAENDGQRIDHIVDTFANFAYDPALISPGVFDLAAIPAADEGYNALQVAAEAASSGAGLLFETGDGKIGYVDADQRPLIRRAGVYQLPPTVVRAELETSSQLADITNEVTVTFAGGAVTEDDALSIAQFGLYARQLTTQLLNQSNAEARAEAFLSTHSGPTVQMSPVAIRVDGLPTDLAEDILDLDINAAVRVPVPNTLRPTNRVGFVEQVVLRFDAFRAELVLFVSDYRLSESAQRWAQVDPTIAWEDVDATLTWQNAIEVTT